MTRHQNDREETIEGERRISEAVGRRRGLTTKQKVVAGTLGTVAIVSFIMWRDPGHRTAAAQPRQPTQIGQTVSWDAAPAPAASPAPPPAPSQEQTIREALAQAMAASGAPVAGKAAEPGKRMFVYGGGEQNVSRATEASAGKGTAAIPGTAASTTVAFKGGEIPGLRAGAAIDDTYVLMPGVIKCALDNAIDTTQPGPIFCHTTEAAKSRAGVTLMERGTSIVGTYSSSIQQGQTRMPAMSAFAITPNGVPVALGMPMGDAIGQAGFPGDVNNHTLARFGGALLLLAGQGVNRR